MANIKAFMCTRPKEEYAHLVAALPYDVYNSKEAREVVKDNRLSFLNIDRAETQFDESVDIYDKKVYEKARDLFNEQVNEGIYLEDGDRAYYIYELTMDGRSQSGIVAVASVDDYLDGTIKKHENTLAKKEQDRINHVDTMSAQTGPIFLAYRDIDVINNIVEKNKKEAPIYDFVADDGISHRVWKISNNVDIVAIADSFRECDSLYIADGHHRAASAVKVALKRREVNPGYTGEEEFNFFLSVIFPESELMIMDYNRVIKDLNGLSNDEFIEKIKENFDVCEFDSSVNAKDEKGVSYIKPDMKGTMSMYLDGKWYKLIAHKDILSDDPVKGLDVSLVSDYIITPILGISDLKNDPRIDFVGGIRGLKELEKRCNEDCKVAFAMYPTSISELFNVADANLLMPPKSTWFEPKLRSGLFIHRF